jgi:hypothetical protein
MSAGEVLFKVLRKIKKVGGLDARLDVVKQWSADRWDGTPPDAVQWRLDKIENAMPFAHERERADNIDRLLSDIEKRLMIEPAIRGESLVKGASEGGKERAKKHGFAHRADELQKEVNDLHGKNKKLSYAEIQERVAKKFKCSPSTVKNYTKNPKKD